MSIDGKAVAFTAAATDYLCFTAEEAGSTIKLSKNGSPPAVLLQKSTDGQNWSTYSINETITLNNVNDTVYFKATGVNQKFSTGTSSYYKFVMTGRIAASGNVNSLLNENYNEVTTLPTYAFNYLFSDCSSLT